MATRLEAILTALQARIALAGVQVLRNVRLPEDVGPGGFLNLHDGNPGEAEATLSPLTWHYQHRAELDIFVQPDDDMDAAFASLVQDIGVALAGDRTLGGLCDWVEPEPPQLADIAETGALPMKAGTIVIVLHYGTTDPLG